jgi:hypothetical protein
MPVLDNARHERFAQALAKGKNASEAYVLAGYKANDGNAATLKGNQRVQARLFELKTKSAEKTGLTVASITERLLRIAEKGEASDEAPMLTVARASLMDAAKLNGLVVDKSLTAQTTVEDLLDQLDGQQVGDTRGAPN